MTWIFNFFIYTIFSYSHFRVKRNIMSKFCLLFLFYVTERLVTDKELKFNFVSVKIHFFARVRKNGSLGPIKLYLKIDQVVNIWWNNSVTSGVRAFILNLNSTGPKQQVTGKRFFKLLGRDENFSSKIIKISSKTYFLWLIPFFVPGQRPQNNDHRVPAIYQYHGHTFSFGIWLRSQSVRNWILF